MKRTQLIEAGILIVGLIFGYKLFESVVTLIMQIVFSFHYGENIQTLPPVLIVLVIYAICFLVLIRRSGQIAHYIGSFSENTSLHFKVNKKALLHIVLIALGLVTILENIGQIIVYLFESFKNEVNSRNFDDRKISISKEMFTLIAIQTIIAFLIIYFSKTISIWFFGKDPVEELTLESTEDES